MWTGALIGHIRVAPPTAISVRSFGECAAKLSGQPHIRRSDYVWQRSVKPSAWPTQVRTMDLPGQQEQCFSGADAVGLLTCSVRLNPEATGRLRLAGANARRGFPALVPTIVAEGILDPDAVDRVPVSALT
jgi:hypothetical protein